MNKKSYKDIGSQTPSGFARRCLQILCNTKRIWKNYSHSNSFINVFPHMLHIYNKYDNRKYSKLLPDTWRYDYIDVASTGEPCQCRHFIFPKLSSID